jgi:AcrR family transcriptional regulator
LSYLRKSPRQKRSAATFEAIVEAAAHFLRKGGGRAMTTNAIAARAGVSIGSLYQYFPDKQAIVRALVEREFARVEDMRPAMIDHADSKADVVRAIVDWHFDIRGNDPALATNLRAVVGEVMPAAEQKKIAALRRERVDRTVARLVGDALTGTRAHAAFIIDTCLNAIADEALRRRPQLLKSATFRTEMAALLLGYVEPVPDQESARGRLGNGATGTPSSTNSRASSKVASP